jgi:hypothetical protein
MKVFAIGDLHLSSTGEKPMDIFGPGWGNHAEVIAANGRGAVAPDDLVLLPGDLSWAMTLEEARPDLEFIESLPGEKYFIRGNHDYWCGRPTRVRQALGPTMHLIRFDAAVYRGVGICGVRGWLMPDHAEYEPERDDKHWRKAALRLQLSLDSLGELDWDVAVAMFHYPPCSAGRETDLCRMIADAGVSHCIYGHLHGEDTRNAFEAEPEGVDIRCVSADHVSFRPVLIFSHPG